MKNFDPLLTQKIYSLLSDEIGMKRFVSDRLDCYLYNEKYYRLDTFYESNGELLYCIEIANSLEDAKNDLFEDAFLYGEKLGYNKIIDKMRNDLTHK